MEKKWFVMVVAVVCVMVPKVAATRWLVGGKNRWNAGVNYTVWAEHMHFYKGDWLFFVYDRNQMNVLEVNKTNYKSCNYDYPLRNWTTGAGRDVVPLNVTRHYYFISGNGFCYNGMKLAIKVENPPPPPRPAPVTNNAPTYDFRGQFVLPAMFAIGAVWDSFIGV